jgi:hypothetical protein
VVPALFEGGAVSGGGLRRSAGTAARPVVRAARRLRLLLAAAALLVLSSAPAAACSVCFGAQESHSPLVSGARLGVFLLLGVTAAVLGGFVKFFLYLRARARRAEIEGIAEEWAQLQRSAH